MNLRSTIVTKQTIFIVIIALILGVGIWRFMITPASTAAAEAQGELSLKQANVVQLRSEVSAAQGGTASDVENDFFQAAKVESILRPNAGREYREFLLAYMPTLPRKVGIEITPQTPAPPTSQDGGMAYIDYSYTFDSTWPQLQAFIQEVRGLPLLTTVQQLATTETGVAGAQQWSSQITVRVWWSELEPLPGYVADPLDYNIQPEITTTNPGPTEGVDAPTGDTVPPTTTTQPASSGSVSQGAVSSGG